MITEDLGVLFRQNLGPLIGVKDITVLNTSEYQEQETPPDWFDANAPDDAYVLYIELSKEPQKHIIKRINDVVHNTRTQVHYITNRKGSNHAYICPTTNNFEALYAVSPARPQRFFQ